MRKITAILLIVLLVVAFSGCKNKKEEPKAPDDGFLLGIVLGVSQPVYTVEATWFRDGVELAGQGTCNADGTAFTKDEVIWLTITAANGVQDGDTLTFVVVIETQSGRFTLQNLAPTTVRYGQQYVAKLGGAPPDWTLTWDTAPAV